MIPSKIKILNHTYKVIEVDEINDDEISDEKDPNARSGEQILGALDDTALHILLVKNIQPSRKYQIFLHEVCHAIFNIIEFHRFLKDPCNEESVINSVSDILFQVLTENNIAPSKQDFKNIKSSEDPNIVSTLKHNFEKGTSVKELSKTFKISEKEVKDIVAPKKKKPTKKTK